MKGVWETKGGVTRSVLHAVWTCRMLSVSRRPSFLSLSRSLFLGGVQRGVSVGAFGASSCASVCRGDRWSLGELVPIPYLLHCILGKGFLWPHASLSPASVSIWVSSWAVCVVLWSTDTLPGTGISSSAAPPYKVLHSDLVLLPNCSSLDGAWFGPLWLDIHRSSAPSL